MIALPEEFRSLAAEYARQWYVQRNPNHPGSDFLFVGPGGHRCIATIMPRMGPTVASQTSTRLLAWKPAVIVNVGIAGGFKDDLRIGDVIVPRQVDAYDETGKAKDGKWERRGSDYRPSADLVAEVHELEFTSHEAHAGWVGDGTKQLDELRRGADQKRIQALQGRKLLREAPIISTNHLASGSFVVANKAFADFIRDADADIHAGEMEAAGMMAAAEYQRNHVSTLVVRGISDHVDADKRKVDAIGEGALRRLAMANAWRLVCTLMELGRLPRAEQASASIQNTPPTTATRTEPKVAPTRLPHKATKLFGREEELRQLDAEWATRGKGKRNVAVIVAWGGVGKTSLVFAWMNRLARGGYGGATAVFDWSFYRQGDRERGASADEFVRAALRFFGDEATADSAASAWQKGARLAELVGRQRALLVLDGLEPLQQPPGRSMAAGKLTDPTIAALLRGLSRTNAGLCVVTTREMVEDLEGFDDSVAQRKLERLSEDAGVELLRWLLEEARVVKVEAASTRRELAAIWKAVDGHALTLGLVGRYLRRRRWDVSRWREIHFEDADGDVQGGHAFRMLGAYERWLAGEEGESVPRGQRMLALLRILGLFDRAADPGSIGAVCDGDAIADFTEPLGALDEGEWAEVLGDLEALGLVSRAVWEPVRVKGFLESQTNLVTGKVTGTAHMTEMPGWSRLGESLDAHPLVREYFGRRVRQASEAAWKEGHRRLFEHLRGSTPYWPEGMYGLGLLYQAVAHGCQAGAVQEACDEVYFARILRGTGDGGFYSTKNLGAFGADLGAVAWFFESPWSRPSPNLAPADAAWLAGQAAFLLHMLGRPAEALEPMRAELDRSVEEARWKTAALHAGNLSGLELTRGEVAEALRLAEQSVALADRSSDEFQRMGKRAIHADALRHAGRSEEARQRFEEAEAMQAERQPDYPQLYSVQGYRYCDLLLVDSERVAWQETLALGQGSFSARSRGVARLSIPNTATRQGLLGVCTEVLERARRSLAWSLEENWLLDTALDNLTLSRGLLFQALLAAPDLAATTPEQWHPSSPINLATAKPYLDAAVEGLYRSGSMNHLPRGLLTRSWFHHLVGGPTAAAADLDEVESLASRGGMRILVAEVHLTRARFFRDRMSLAKARELLHDLGTRGCRLHDDMLTDAEAAAESWPDPT